MGIFDWFGKKTAAPPIEPPRDHGKPRPQHYEFAHRMLPVFVFRDPARAIALLGGEQSASLLESMWRTTGKNIAQRGLPTFDAQFAPAQRRSIAGATAWLVECPATATALEAAWVAVVQPASSSAQAAYFTLEVGTRTHPSESPYHVVCLWRHQGFPASPQQWLHRNTDIRCAPDAEAFAAAIAQAIAP